MTGADDPRSLPILAGEDLRVDFIVDRRVLRAVDGVTIEVPRGRTVALVGESGSGKSTVARALTRARPVTAGRVLFDGNDITHVPERKLVDVRRRLQMIFQDPFASLDPHMTVARIVGEPLVVHTSLRRSDVRARVARLLEVVGFGPDALERRPREFSGGQRQRIAIARALIVEPEVLIADEPVSALDVSIQAQIVNLLTSIQAERGISLLMISHDLALVNAVADRVIVMYLGRVVEQGDTDDVISNPQHPYTVALLSATPTVEATGSRQRIVLRGEPTSPLSRPSGCAFHPRCPIATNECRQHEPPLASDAQGRRVACFHAGELAATRTNVTMTEPAR